VVHTDAPLAQYLAEMAHLESAAVFAFRELASELRRFGAPEALVLRAQEAEQDEIRHADVMSRHARSFGAAPATAQVTPKPYASLFDLALHNAQEGCVRETYGALVAMHQAEHAGNDALRADLGQIAQEEVRHAAWSHDLDAWLQAHLTAEQTAAVAHAKAEAFAQLEREGSAHLAPELLRQAGLPSARVAQALVAELKRESARGLS
jgi:hypothetical protein